MNGNKIKKPMSVVLALSITTGIFAGMLTGCGDQATRVSYNLSKEADNFNNVRQVTVINCLEGGCSLSDDGQMLYNCGYC